jgi:hypothetical protein
VVGIFVILFCGGSQDGESIMAAKPRASKRYVVKLDREERERASPRIRARRLNANECQGGHLARHPGRQASGTEEG